MSNLCRILLVVAVWLSSFGDASSNTDDPFFPYDPDEATTVLYHLDDVLGAVIEDASGNGLDGSLTGSAISVQGRFGRCLEFDGGVKLKTSASSLFLSTSLTLEAWIYVTEPRDAVLVDTRGLDIPVETGRALLITSEGRVIAVAQQAHSPAYWAGSETLVPLHTWTHVAGIFDQSNALVSVAVNGVEEATEPAFNYVGADRAAVAGSLTRDAEYFAGRIDEVRISSTARVFRPVPAVATTWGRIKSLWSEVGH